MDYLSIDAPGRLHCHYSSALALCYSIFKVAWGKREFVSSLQVTFCNLFHHLYNQLGLSVYILSFM